MLSRWARRWSGKIFGPLLFVLERAGVTPDQLSLASLAVTAAAGLLFARGNLAAGAWLFLLGGLLDSLDGELARTRQLETPLGAFLDSVCDHLGDFALAVGLAWHFLAGGKQIEVLLVVAGLFGSVFGSHVRSRAGMLGIDLKQVGAFTRMERTLVLSLGILAGLLTPTLWVLAVLNNLSAFERVAAVLRRARDLPAQTHPSQTEGVVPEKLP